MAAIRSEFVLWRGGAPTLTLNVVKDDGTPEDVTGWTATLTLRVNDTDPDPPAFTKDLTVSGAGTNGVLSASLSKTETLGLVAGRYVFTIARTNIGDDPLAFGVVTVKNNVKDAVA